MNLLVISNLFPNKLEPNRGIFNYQQINYLSKKCNLSVVAPVSWLNVVKWKGVKSIHITKCYEVVHPIYFYTPKLFRFLYGYFYYFSILKQVRSLISSKKPVAIFSTWAYPDSFASCLIAKEYNLPVIIKVHGTDIHSVQGVLRKRLTSWSLRSCREVVSVSETLKYIMVNDFNVPEEKISVIPNGVDKSKFYPMQKDEISEVIPTPKESQKFCIFIGNLKEEKNIRMLVHAFIKVINTYGSHNVLHILGNGSLYNEISGLIKINNMQENIILHGVVDHSLIPDWMNMADLLILPSDNEGMPNVVLEARACGTPVLLSNIDAHNELVEEGVNGYLFNLKDVDDLVEKINLALVSNLDSGVIAAMDNVITWEENVDILLSKILH